MVWTTTCSGERHLLDGSTSMLLLFASVRVCLHACVCMQSLQEEFAYTRFKCMNGAQGISAGWKKLCFTAAGGFAWVCMETTHTCAQTGEVNTNCYVSQTEWRSCTKSYLTWAMLEINFFQLAGKIRAELSLYLHGSCSCDYSIC